MDDLFDKIIRGDVPSEKIYEDEYTYAFLDINPNNPGHTLVVPKVHSTNVLDITEDDWVHLMKTVRLLAPKVKEAMEADGVHVYMNNEPTAFQEIMHTHVHIIPRHKGDGFHPWKGTPYSSEEISKVGDAIRALL
ncbi:MAG: HIT family protein [Candidatus Pacebacteria bacterium]|nr:HIT family protein [Candidatus Paceibacterota bacterium]